MVPADQLRREIDERLLRGQLLLDDPVESEDALKERRQDYYTWTEYNEALLRHSFDSAEPAEEYASMPMIGVIGGSPEPLHVRWNELRDDILSKKRRLKSIQERLRLFRVHPDAVAPAPPPPDPTVLGDDVFIVHGHDGEAKVTVARFLERLIDREPIVLHEQADRGRTIIEKFEEHAARAAFAVALLTGDDVGGLENGDKRPRARQNVVLELGFFLGKLGRARVVILYESDVELPSDLNGVLYVPLDGSGAWRNVVARELQAAGLDVNLAALIS